jgi:hypothetical protein
MTDTTVVKTIARVRALNASAAGNPRFKVTFTDGTSALTQTDAAVNYAIENSEYQGVPVEFTMTGAGRIRFANIVKQEKA